MADGRDWATGLKFSGMDCKVAVFLQRWPEVPSFAPTDAQFARFADAVRSCGGTAVLARDEDSFLAALHDATHAIVWDFRQEWFAKAPRLREIGTPAAGKDYFRIVPPPGVSLGYGSFHGAIIGETATAAVLAFSHGLLPPAPPDALRPWPRHAFAAKARRLAGATVVLLGFGAIGRAAGRFMKPFGPKIVGVSRTAHPAPDWFGPEDLSLGLDSLDAVLPQADFLVLFLPSGAATDSILDARRIAMLKPTAFVLNYGRGNAIDETALAEALRAGRIAGAALDVFREEPLRSDSPLLSAPNCVLTPHSSAFSPDYLDLFFGQWLAGHGMAPD